MFSFKPTAQQFNRAGILLLLAVLLPHAFPVEGQSLTSCPSASDLGSPRVVCTHGTYSNPYRDTGIVAGQHSYSPTDQYILLGTNTQDTVDRAESVTYLFHVDTQQTSLLTLLFQVFISYDTEIPVSRMPYFDVQLFDSVDTPLIDPCAEPLHCSYPVMTWSRYDIRMQPYHNRTLKLRITNAKPGGYAVNAYSTIKFECHSNVHDSITVVSSGSECSQAYQLNAPPMDGYLCQWYCNESPVVQTRQAIGITDPKYHYRCRLGYSTRSGDSVCTFSMMTPPLLTFQKIIPDIIIDTLDTIQPPGGFCQLRMRITDNSHVYRLVQTPTGVDSIIISQGQPSETHIYQDNVLLTNSASTVLTLSRGQYKIRVEHSALQCTSRLTRYLTVPSFCHCEGEGFFRCPTVYDLDSFRTVCSYGRWNWDGSAACIYYQYQTFGVDSHHHHLVTIQGTDPHTGGLLPLIPPGESASIRLGNDNVYSETESITFYYVVDTGQSSLLVLRYAAVLQDPRHNPEEQPHFTFEILDAQGNHLNEGCYSASFVADPTLGWRTAPDSSILWKEWTTVGADLSNVHGQTIQIILSTYDCSQSGHFGYAYFTLGCHGRQIQSTHCLDSSHYTAPDGFTYQWYPDGYPDSVVATTRKFSTTSRQQFHCRLRFIGAPAGSDCYTLISTTTPVPKYPVASFTLDTVDTVDCRLVLRVVNTSRIVEELTPDSVEAHPCPVYQYIVDGTDSIPGADTLLLSLDSGMHTLTLIVLSDETPCTDTLRHTFFVDNPCLCRFEEYDTIAQALLPYTAHGFTITEARILPPEPTLSPLAFDTTVFIPGLRPGCDTLIDYHLRVYLNCTDTLLFFLCPGEIPFPVGDGAAISADTAIVFRGGHGEDSTVVYRVFLLADSDTSIADSILENQLPWAVFDTVFTDTVTGYPFHLYNEQGCDSTIHYTLYVFWNGDHCDTTLQFPTAVTPNGDGINDRFVIGGLLENDCFKFNDLVVYDRTGHLVYHGHNIAKDSDWWNPDSPRVPDATYFYVFKAHGVDIHTLRQGVIEVLR